MYICTHMMMVMVMVMVMMMVMVVMMVVTVVTMMTIAMTMMQSGFSGLKKRMRDLRTFFFKTVLTCRSSL